MWLGNSVPCTEPVFFLQESLFLTYELQKAGYQCTCRIILSESCVTHEDRRIGALAVVLPWLFFRFVMMGKCVFNGKWKADEKFKAWIAADPTSKTKAMCVVCNKAIDISSMGEAALQSHMIGKKHKKLMELKVSSPSVTHFLSSSSENSR